VARREREREDAGEKNQGENKFFVDFEHDFLIL